jgi:hypothetical protein
MGWLAILKVGVLPPLHDLFTWRGREGNAGSTDQADADDFAGR